MKMISYSIAGMALFFLVASQAAAQGIVQYVPDVPLTVSQDAYQASPSDLVVPMIPQAETPGDSGWFNDWGFGGMAGCSAQSTPFEIYSRDRRGIKVGGWTQLGYHHRNSAADFFNQYQDHLALHQQWFYVDRIADGQHGLDWGFRFDLMYGIDADNTQAYGNNFGRWDYRSEFQHGEYGWALPQAYLELAYGDLSVIGGHFLSPIGYEVVPSPQNFFYSRSFSRFISQPVTHTGILATYDWTERLSIFLGWTLGWNTGLDQFGSGSSWLGGLSYELSDRAKFTYMSTYGDFGRLGAPFNAPIAPGKGTGDDCYSHNIILDLDLTERLKYVFVTDYTTVPDVAVESVGITQYLLYHWSDRWALGARVEWWKPNAVGFFNNSGNAATFGVNYRPHANVVIRPEIKQEWVPGAGIDQTIFGIDMVLTY